MGAVIRLPKQPHARASAGSNLSWKSSAVIAPPLYSLSFPIVDQSGRTIWRRIRLTVTRVTSMAEATSSSDNPRSFMNSDKCAMPDLYAGRTEEVKPICALGVLYRDNLPVHDAYMPAKKVVSRPKRPEFRPPFIKQWRKYRNEMTQEQLAERVATYLTERGLARGYSHASVGRIENGKMPYKQPVLEAMADALGTDAASLLIRDPTDPEGIWTLWEKALPVERQTITEHAQIVVKRRAERG